MGQWLQDVAVGEWYDVAGNPYEVVGVDVKAEIVLVQHFDGTLEEFDFDQWTELNARQIAAPEDYSGALDIEKADYGMELDTMLSQGSQSIDDLLDGRFDERF